MASQRWAVAGMTSLALLLLGVGAGVPALAGTAQPAGPAAGHRTGCFAGARTLAPHGSHLYPDTGNGGYTSLHTDVHLVYDAASNRFLAGNHVTLTDQATQCLTSFSLDFERRSVNATAGPDLTVGSVLVNGHPASIRFVQPTYPGDPKGQDDPNPLAHEASQVNPVGGPHHNPLPPACSPELTSTNPAKKWSKNGTQCPANKLVITPQAPIGTGSTFRVTVAYTGRPGVHNDGDGTTEGWFRSNQPKGDGGFVTTEPVGTEDWMPLNDYPTAKPTYDFYDTVNSGKTVLANGMLESRQPHPASAQFPHGSVTWHWHSAAPVASYLVEDSVGQLRPDPADRRRDQVLPGPGQLAERGAEGQEPHDHEQAAGHHQVREQVHRAVPVHLGRRGRRPAIGLLRGGDADDDHLRGRRDRHRHAVPREHAPVVG